MIKYSQDTGVVIYSNFLGNVGMATNGTPAFTLINLQQNDDKAQFCCKVSTKRTGASLGDVYMDCVTLKLLGKTKRNIPLKLHSYLIFCPSSKVTFLTSISMFLVTQQLPDVLRTRFHVYYIVLLTSCFHDQIVKQEIVSVIVLFFKCTHSY